MIKGSFIVQQWTWKVEDITPSLQIPHTVETFSLDVTAKQGRRKLREEFYKNSHVRDPRVIDMLVIKVGTICGRREESAYCRTEATP